MKAILKYTALFFVITMTASCSSGVSNLDDGAGTDAKLDGDADLDGGSPRDDATPILPDGGYTFDACPSTDGGPTIIACRQLEPTAVAIDEQSVYWGRPFGEVNRVDKVGGPTVTLALEQSPAVAIATDARGVYWLTEGGVLVWYDLRSSERHVVSTREFSPRDLTSDGSHVYWLSNRGILRRWSAGDSTEFIADVNPEARSLAVDDSTIYVLGPVITSTSQSRAMIQRVGKVGGGAPEVFVEGGSMNLDEVMIAATGSHVYWTEFTCDHERSPFCANIVGCCRGAISRLAKNAQPGSVPEVVAAESDYRPVDFVIRDDELFWTTIRDVRKSRLGTSEVVTIAVGQGWPRGISADELYLYWADPRIFGDSAVDNGVILRLARD